MNEVKEVLTYMVFSNFGISQRCGEFITFTFIRHRDWTLSSIVTRWDVFHKNKKKHKQKNALERCSSHNTKEEEEEEEVERRNKKRPRPRPRAFVLNEMNASRLLFSSASSSSSSFFSSSSSRSSSWLLRDNRRTMRKTTTSTATNAGVTKNNEGKKATDDDEEDDRGNTTFDEILSVLQAHKSRRLSVAAECRTLVSNASFTGGVLCTMTASSSSAKKDGRGERGRELEEDGSSSYPVGSFAAFAVEESDVEGANEGVDSTRPATAETETAAGLPIFALSQLSSHTRDLSKNKRASLFCAESGGMRPDAARATLVGSVEKIEDEKEKAKAREIYLKQHPDAFWVDFGDFSWFKMTELKEVKYVGGFGRAATVSATEYQSAKVDPVRKFSGPVCKHMNEDHAESTLDIVKMEVFGEENMHLLRSSDGSSSSSSSTSGGSGDDENNNESMKAEMCEIDSIGMTVSLRFGSQNLGKVRIEWPEPANDRKAIKDQIVNLTKKAAAAAAAATKE